MRKPRPPVAVVVNASDGDASVDTRPDKPDASRLNGSVALAVPAADDDKQGRVAPATEPATRGVGDERTEIDRAAAARSKRWILYAVGAWAILAVAALTSMVVVGTRSEPDSWPRPDDRVHDGEPPATIAAAGPAPVTTAPSEPTARGPAQQRPADSLPPPNAPVPPPADPVPAPSEPARPQPDPAPPATSGGIGSRHDHRAPSERVTLEPTVGKPMRPTPVRHVQASRAAQSTKPAPDKINTEDVYRTGLLAWVHGDTKTALASYRRVLQANPTYAAAWRGVGLVYERLGDKASARSAFQRYLTLVPGAFDAAGIRARLESP
jgi:hypothetical protein